MTEKKKTYPMSCPCGYKWNARIPHPVSCPRCKQRFDYEEGRKRLRKVNCKRCA